MTVPTFPRLDDLLTAEKAKPDSGFSLPAAFTGVRADRDRARSLAAALEAQSAAVLHLHQPVESDNGSRRLDCAECGFWYPCPTARILLPDYTEPAAVGG